MKCIVIISVLLWVISFDHPSFRERFEWQRCFDQADKQLCDMNDMNFLCDFSG